MAYTLKQLTLAWTAAHGGVAPDATTLADLENRAFQNAAGAMTDAQVLGFVLNSADNSTALAALSYQFFTGKSPTKDGLAYLVNSAANPNDLSDAYYGQFNLENRYINFAANLGVQGEGKDAFAGKYGAMNFADYVASIYESIIGSTYAKAAGIDVAKAIADIIGRQDAILATAKSAGMITSGMSQAQIDLALKAATAGYLLGEAIKADVGLYAASANNFMLALAKGDAVYNTDLTTTYKPTPGSGSDGTGHAIDTAPNQYTLPGGPPPPPPPEPEPDPVAHSFTLTTGANIFTGESLSDTFTGVANYNAGSETGNMSTTFNVATDILDGGDGYDTLALTMAGTNNPSLTLDGTKIRNIERLTVTSTVGTTRVTLTGTSFTELVVAPSAIGFSFAGYGTSVTKLGLTGLALGTASFTANGAALTGNADAVTLTLTNVGSASATPTVSLVPNGGVNTDFYETLNLVSSGAANYLQLSTGGNQTSLARLNISGSTPLTLAFSSIDKIRVTPTIDASATTGGVTIGSANVGLGVASQTVKLGSGDDVVYFGISLDANDTVDGGAGNDVISIGTGLTSAAFAHVSNFEAIRFNPNGGGSMTQDLAQLPSGWGLQVGGSNGTLTLQNATNSTTVDVFKANASLNVALQLANGGGGSTDAVTLRFNAAGSTGATLFTLSDIAGLETLNIVSTGTATNAINNDRVLARHVVTGSTDMQLVFGTTAGAVTVDASAFTGKLDVTGPTGQTLTVTGGTGKDSFTGEGGDRFILGAQGQNFQSGADVINAHGTGSTVAFVGNIAAGTGAATNLLAGVAIADGSSAVSGLTLTFSADNHDFSLKNAAGTAFTGLAKGSVAQGLTAGDTLVEQNLGNNDHAVAATANLGFIKLTANGSMNNSASVAQLFADAIGNSSITGLAANGNYLVAVYDGGSSQKTVLAVVNVGASGAGDTTLSAADFTDSGVALIGYVSTSSFMANLSLGVAF